eukprot:1160459-Pelagomonas_calceolata.AAC.10
MGRKLLRRRACFSFGAYSRPGGQLESRKFPDVRNVLRSYKRAHLRSEGLDFSFGRSLQDSHAQLSHSRGRPPVMRDQSYTHITNLGEHIPNRPPTASHATGEWKPMCIRERLQVLCFCHGHGHSEHVVCC